MTGSGEPGPDVSMGGDVPVTWSRRRLGALFLASTSSRLAQSASGAAVPLYLLQVLDSAADVGLVLAARAVPSLVAGPFTGAWLDRTSRRRLPFAASQLLLLASLGALVAVADGAPLTVVVALALLSGLTGPVLTAGFTGLIQPLVPPHLLQRAYGAEGASYNVAGIAGPALAGAAAAVWSPEVAAWTSVVLVALSLLTVVGLDARSTRAPDRTPVLRAVRGGFLHVARAPLLRAVTVGTTVEFVGWGATVVAFPLLVLELTGSTAAGGSLFVVAAVGAVLGSLAVAVRPPASPPARTVAAGLLLLAVAFLLLAAAPALVPAAALVLVAGAVAGPVLPATLTVRAATTPAALRNQVVVTAASLKGGAAALGSALAGVVAAAAGARAAVLLVAAAMLLAGGLTAVLLRTATPPGGPTDGRRPHPRRALRRPARLPVAAGVRPDL